MRILPERLPLCNRSSLALFTQNYNDLNSCFSKTTRGKGFAKMAKTDKSEKTEKKKLRVGIIGAGGIAGTHTDNYRKMEDVEVLAACDSNEANLKKYSEKYGIKSVFGDWKSMLAETKLDAVSVCTPNGLHMAASVDALNAGCHVIVEKP